MGRNKKTPHKRHKSGFRGPSPDVGKATQFKPGVSGNPGGRPSKRLLDEMYEELLLADNAEAAKAIALAMLKRARKGDVKSAQLINERTQGKPKQQTELSGPGGGALQVVIRNAVERPVRV